MNKLIIKLIKFYQKNNPNPGRCRYMPSCSAYGLECFQKFNFFIALALTIWRILRCNPFSKGGYNPPPKCICEKEYYYLVYQFLNQGEK